MEKYKTINHNKIRQIEFLQKITVDIPDIYPPFPAIKPDFSKTNKNVGIIFWYLPQPHIQQETPKQQQQPPFTRQIQILTGIETCYLTDKMVPEIKSIIQKYQLYQFPTHYNNNNNNNNITPIPPTTTTQQNQEEEVYEIFSKRAKLLSKELKYQVYFDKPIAHPTHPGLWQVQFRVKSESQKYGILKGSMEEKETQLRAIHREIQEELFPYNEYIPLEPEKICLLPNPIQLNQDTLYTFHYPLNQREKETIEANISHLQEKQYGELIQYQFRPMTEIFTSPQSTQPNYHLLKQFCNGKSRLYIKEFYDYIQETYL